MQKDQEDSILFEAKTLEEAYNKATIAFDCSLTQLKSEVLQSPSSGFLGLFSKNAIIKVYSCKGKNKSQEYHSNENTIKIKDLSESLNLQPKVEEPIVSEGSSQNSDIHPKDAMFDSFYTQDKRSENNDIVLEIKEKVTSLFSHLCYDLNEIEVSFFDEKTIYITFTGKDAALLIGKEGFRYKALSYILFNWIHDKYNLMLKLEIEQFLKNQEEAVARYLVNVIGKIHQDGYYKTKVFDGVLLHIALESLRLEFPNKYVAIKTNKDNEKYILVNEYKSNDKH